MDSLQLLCIKKISDSKFYYLNEKLNDVCYYKLIDYQIEKGFGNWSEQMKLLKVGDLVETPPNEMHALKITKEGNEFIVFTVGKRGGKDYEDDTFRFTPTLIQ